MTKSALLAGGCFWGLQDLIRTLPGVVDTEVAYTGGKNNNPTYEFHPGHAETVLISYDDDITSYRRILDFFFQIHNPTTLNQQGNDKGTAYRSAIFYADESELEEATMMIATVDESGRWADTVVTTLERRATFWPAEDYHQDYLKNNPGGYTCHAIYFESYLNNPK